MSTANTSLEITYALLLSVNDGKSVGSGFRIKIKDTAYLVTARHVIYDGEKLYGETLIVTSYDEVETDPVIFSVDLSQAKIFEDESSDCAVIVFGERGKVLSHGRIGIKTMPYVKIIQDATKKGKSAPENLTKRICDITVASTVFLLGYPTSLGMLRNDYYDFTRPLLRMGTVAGISKKKGTFVIDCAAYPGNSGGPVVEYCKDGKHRIIGFVSRYIPFETKWYNNRERIHNIEIANSGYTVCVALDVVFQLTNAS